MQKRKKIVIAEDQKIVALDLELSLKRNGYREIVSFCSGKKAIEYIDLQKPDLVLLDIRLQDEVTGLDIAEKLNRLNIPFIFVSAFSNPDNYRKAFSLKAVKVFRKPYILRDLINTVDDILGDTNHK